VPDGAATFVISHGGLIEPGLVACFPGRECGAWRAPFMNLEGARLVFDGTDWVEMDRAVT
jgi:hypothetical protein